MKEQSYGVYILQILPFGLLGLFALQWEIVVSLSLNPFLMV